MKNIFTLLLSITFITNVLAQEKNIEKLKQKIEETPYVIEGEILNVEIYAGDKEGNPIDLSKDNVTFDNNGLGYYKQSDGANAIVYSKATIQVCKTYKGNIQQGTIEIITKRKYMAALYNPEGAGFNNKEGLFFNEAVTESNDEIAIYLSQKGLKGFFFLKDFSSKEKANIGNVYTLVKIYGGISIFSKDKESITYYNDAYAGGFNQLFKTKEELNEFLKQFKSLNLNAPNYCNPTPEKKNVGLNEFLEKEKIEIDYQQQLNNYNNWLTQNQKRLKENIKLNTTNSKKAEGLILEIDNERLTGASAGPKYLEFDIMAYGTSNSVYFDNCLMRIQYNPSAFGSSLVTNGNVTITANPIFSATTYLDPQAYVIDQTTNTLGIPFGVEFAATTINRTALTIFPTKMLTVKIKIQNCSVLSNINFTDTASTNFASFYAINANDPITAGISYSLTQYTGSITDKTCDPIITNFTNNIASGVGNILTITGKYFGDSKVDNARVMFKNANNGVNGGSYPPNGGPNAGGIQHYDVVSWTNNEIKIKLPSVIDSVTDPLNGFIPVKVTPGSGKFKVRNRYNSETETQQKLLIPYGIAQQVPSVTFPYGKYTVELSGLSANNGYILHMHPDVETTFPGAKAIIKKALKDWRCVSGINWQLGNDTNLTIAQDNINMIALYNGGGTNPAQSAELLISTCSSGPTVLGSYIKSFDVKIDQTINWQVDSSGILQTGKEDFYHAFAHELGHAHTLKHALDTITNDTLQGIMFSNLITGEVPSLQRKTVFNSPNAIDGGQFVTSNNISGTACAGSHTLVVENCSVISVEEYDNANLNISHYPNPINNGNLTVEFELEKSANTYFFLYDNTGKLITQSSLAKIKNVNYLLPVDNLSNGIYYLQVIADSQRQTVKFIKQ
jgi:hypothetical protein